MSFAANSDFLISKSLQPNVVNLRYFKLRIPLDQIINISKVYTIRLHRCRNQKIRVCDKDSIPLWFTYPIKL